MVSNLLAWLTFPNDHDLMRYSNRFNELVLKRKMNLNLDSIQIDEHQDLESLFRHIEINFNSFSKDIDLLDLFLMSNGDFLMAKQNNLEFNDDLNLSFSTVHQINEINITKIYKQTQKNYEQTKKRLRTSFDYDLILRLMRNENKNFIKNYLIKRDDFKSDNQSIDELKKLFQIT